MNHSYRLVWSNAVQRYIPAPETARGWGKSRAVKALAPMLLGALLALPAWADPPASNALPIGGQVVNGQVRIEQNAAQMTIDQASPKAILHWQGFDIGNGAKVQFNQPGASAIALNRVVAGNASQIDGQLSSNGQVWLVNPNGVVFGKGSQVNVGGLVASTLDITNQDFNAGKQVFTRGAAQGGITNQGTITAADGGLVALLAPTVKNEGVISARLGNVVLAGGDSVTLQAGADGRLQVALDPASVRTLIDNQQMIVADGGQVVMTASAADALSASVVSNNGTVQARTLVKNNGRILLHADMRHGQVEHSGLLDASAPDEGDGGGLLETRAAKVQIQAGARVTTAAARGETGLWHNDSAADLSISAAGAPIASNGIGADTLAAGLAHTNIALHTTAAGNEQGDIQVDADIAYERNQLTLSSPRAIVIQAAVSVNDSGTLRLNYGGTAGNADTVPNAESYLLVSKPVTFAKEGSGLLSINGHDFSVIKSLDALQAMDTSPVAKYALGGKLDAHATADWNGRKGFAPVGSSAQPFQGTFDGMGNIIQGLTILRPDQDGVGLFGHATNATLRNVTLLMARVKGKNSVGTLVGAHQADKGGVATIFLTGSVNARVIGLRHVGAMVGRNDADGGTASIAHTGGMGTVSGLDEVGGLVGRNRATSGGTATIFNAVAHGSVRGSNDIGGLVGANMSQDGTANIYASRATGSVKGVEHVGGLVGRNNAASGAASITDSHATGNVSGSDKVGGLVGYNYASDKGAALIVSAHATGQVKGVELVGGLVGDNHANSAEALIITSHASGNTSGHQSVGGLVGSHRAGADGLAEIDGARATGEVRGVTQAGGLVGSKDAGSGTARISRSQPSGRMSGVQEAGGSVGGNHGTGAGAAGGSQAPASAKAQGASDIAVQVGQNQGAINDSH